VRTASPPRLTRGFAAASPHCTGAGIASLVTRGLTNKEIADELVISVKTVEHHLGSVFGKLGVSNRTQLFAAMAGYQHPVPTARSVERFGLPPNV
jgi:DNA-binding CsgD family transcriptional regulator